LESAQPGGAYRDHLAVLSLVVRRSDLASKLLFQITERGLKRLEWLRAQDKPLALEKLLLPILRAAPSRRKAKPARPDRSSCVKNLNKPLWQ
jgi:hypothetical protein